jgi:hypothetical protein
MKKRSSVWISQYQRESTEPNKQRADSDTDWPQEMVGHGSVDLILRLYVLAVRHHTHHHKHHHQRYHVSTKKTNRNYFSCFPTSFLALEICLVLLKFAQRLYKEKKLKLFQLFFYKFLCFRNLFVRVTKVYTTSLQCKYTKILSV